MSLFDKLSESLNEIVKSSFQNNDNFKTRIYSDFFASYQEAYFIRLGYLLHKVNHSVWFGQGLFNTNTVEDLWSKIKLLSNDFSGISFNVLELFPYVGISKFLNTSE